jgi:hemerythrin-like domain-containing protein
VANILDTLALEQAYIARMIDLLDEQLEILRDPTRDADYQLLREIARYFCHYPTAIHYPFVDTLFDYLAELEEGLKPRVGETKRRHERHARLVDDVYGLLDGVCSGHMIPRDRLLKEAAAYVALHRDHMAPIDAELFDAACDRLSESDLETVEKRWNQHTAPSLRAKIEDEFTRMREAIEALHSEDITSVQSA